MNFLTPPPSPLFAIFNKINQFITIGVRSSQTPPCPHPPPPHTPHTHTHQKLKYYLREKQYIKDHSVHILEQIISCIEERYCKVYSDDFYERNDSKYDTSDEGDGQTCKVAMVIQMSNCFISNSNRRVISTIYSNLYC